MKLLALTALLLALQPPSARALDPSADFTSTSSNRLSGIPFYQIYEEKDINDTSHGNFITSAPDGTLFFGNETGIYTFDGANWKLWLRTEATRDKIRALCWNEFGVFGGGFGSIGRIEFDPETGIQYVPINHEPLSSDASEVYFNIERIKNNLYFIGQRSVVRYDLESEEIHTSQLDSWTKGYLTVGNQLLVACEDEGVIVFEGGTFSKHPAFNDFKGNDVILEFDKNEAGEVFFFTQSNKVFHVPASRDIENYQRFAYDAGGQIKDIAFVADKQLAISISGKGIVVIDTNGNQVASLPKTIDYRWGAASKLHVDKYGTLWSLFKSSVGKILVNDPLTQIDERLRPVLEWPSGHEYAGTVYIRGLGKIYTPKLDSNGSLESFVDAAPEIDQSIALALATHDGLFIHAEKQSYLLNEKGLKPLGESARFDRLKSFHSDPYLMLALSSNSAKLLSREGDSIKLISSIPHNAGQVNKIAREDGDVFWLEIGIGRIGKIWLENDKLRFKLFNAEDGLPNDWICIWEHEGTVLFTSRSGIYQFDESSQHFALTDRFEAYLPAGKGSIHRVATDPKGNLWASYDRFNYILWKQKDGSYIQDHKSLNQLGELYANEFRFLANGDTLILTGTELFHVSGEKLKSAHKPEIPPSLLLEISNNEGSRIYFQNTGGEQPMPEFKLETGERSFNFRIGNSYSPTIAQPEFQYYLTGLSRAWSKWSSSNEIPFNKLEAGQYTLKVRSRIQGEVSEGELDIPFTVPPTFWETPIADAIYIFFALAALLSGYRFFTRKLKGDNEKLEQMVAERTKEIEIKNSELEKNAADLTSALDELKSAQEMLISSSRKAGMAEVAINVLHNVGNVLNSINVSTLSLAERLGKQRVSKLSRVSELINSHQENLETFLTQDPKGKAVPAYLTQLSQVLQDDFNFYLVEVECMSENIEHVKNIIATQQQHAKTVDVFQNVKIPELIESAVEMIIGDFDLSNIEMSRDFDKDLEIFSDKHRILQMLANFIKNAHESIQEANQPIGYISLSAKKTENGESIRILISDNGVGIAEESSLKIFTHGFTTKRDGHGFGMHSSANSAKVLGGDLQIKSDGLGLGATVTLTLPVQPQSHKTSQEKPSRIGFDFSLS